MKKFSLIIGLLLSWISGYADSGYLDCGFEDSDFRVDGVGYAITSVRSPATVKAVNMTYTLESVTIPKEVTYQEQTFKVTELGYYLFVSPYYLKSIDIQAEVTEIPKELFRECKKLEKLTGLEKLKKIPEGMFEVIDPTQPIFYACALLVEFPEFPNVEEIGDRAFRNSAIRNIGGMAKLKKIGEEAFIGCNQLTSIAGPAGLENIGKNAFRDCESLSEAGSLSSLKEIGDYAFYGCKSLSNVGSLSSLTKLGEYAFYGCESLSEVGSLSSLKELGGYAFYGCRSLTKFPELPELRVIQKGVFEGSGLKDFPSMPRLAEIGDEVFMNYGFQTFPDFPELKKIGKRAFAGNDFKEITLTSAVELGDYAFADCKELEKVDLQKINEIPDGCFSGCVKLRDFIHAPYLRRIDSHAFEGTDLRSFPDSPNLGVGSCAFNGVSGIESIVIHENCKMGINCFAGMTGVRSITIEEGKTIDFCEFAVLKIVESDNNGNWTRTDYDTMPLEKVEICRPVIWLGTFLTDVKNFDSNPPDTRWRYSYGNIEEYIPPYPDLKEVRISHAGGAYPPPFYNPDAHIIFDCDYMEMPPRITVHQKYDKPDYYSSDWSKKEYLQYLQKTKKVTFGPRMKKIWAECFGGLKDIYCEAMTPPEFVESHFANRLYIDATLHVPEDAIPAYMSTPGWQEFYKIVPSGVDDIGVEAENLPSRYFDLNGREVYGNLSPGIYIERRGNEARKVVIK